MGCGVLVQLTDDFQILNEENAQEQQFLGVCASCARALSCKKILFALMLCAPRSREGARGSYKVLAVLQNFPHTGGHIFANVRVLSHCPRPLSSEK